MSMMTFDTQYILDAGAKYLDSNHPDHLAKKIVLAQLLVSARYCPELSAAFIAFKVWATDGAREYGADRIIRLANEQYEKKKREVR